MAPPASELPEGYAAFLADLKARVERERVRVVVAANSALVLLYWDLGKAILDRQAAEGWGAKVVDRLASDLAAQIFKNPYLFDFLGTADPRREREVELALVEHIQR